MTEDDKTSVTTAKTLWSQTILEILYQTLRGDKPDDKVREILKEVRLKGFKPRYIVSKVEQNVDKRAALRIKGMLQKDG